MPDTITAGELLLCYAAHELGHALAFRAAGIRVLSITVSEDGGGLTRAEDPTAEQLDDFLVAVLAGRAAEFRWMVRKEGFATGQARVYADRAARHDLAGFRSWRTRGCLSEAQASRRAERFVDRHWGRITRLAPKLARAGHLPVSSL